MAPVGEVGSVTSIGAGRTFDRDPTDAAVIPAQHVPVPVTPEPSTDGVPPHLINGRATAPFLAHLIATAQGAPQTRVRRRTDPIWAVTTYGAMMQSRAPAGRAIRESR